MVIKIPRDTLVRVVSVILRVPALFIAEAWYRTDLKAVHHQYYKSSGQELVRSQQVILQTVYYLAILLALTLIVLPLKKLVNLYMYLVSGLLLALAHYASYLYVQYEKEATVEVTSLFEDTDAIHRLGFGLVSQGVISAVIAHLLSLNQWSKLLLLIYTSPMLARLLSYPVEDLHRVHNFAFIIILIVVVYFIFNLIPDVLDFLKGGLQRVTLAMQLYGWIHFIVAVWLKILLPVQFLIFWVVLFLMQLYKYFSIPNHPIFSEGWIVVLLASIGESCVTPVSFVGLCVTTSYVSYLLLTLTKLYLQGMDAFLNNNVMHRGWTEGFTMFLLGLQTGLIELKAAQRAFLMSIVLFIVLSSLIQSMYEITDPILLTLSASQNKSILKHSKAVLLCTFLWIFPLYMTYIIGQFFELDFWLLVVISSCVLTSVQVIGSLIIYTLFIYDGLREQPWQDLDDVIYYAKATTRVLEFIIAVFVVCYGVKESLFGEWSWINSSILIVHCYFNVWQRLQSGWKNYMLRREAVKKIESLPLATKKQLDDLNDVCAICFQELKSARVTACQHYFHGICLRKWLYVQEDCPLCHQKISILRRDQNEAGPQQESDQAPPTTESAHAENPDSNATMTNGAASGHHDGQP